MSRFALGDGPPGQAPAPPIRKLIRCKTTKAFLTRDRTWTRDVLEAADFYDRSHALELKRELRLTDIELYCLFGDEPNVQYDFALAL